ncbi:MAG: DUF6636 domain-containing protein [Nocardioidaceae bacterium]
MRRYVVVLAVLSCVVTGCASASDVRADMGASDDPPAEDGGKRADKRVDDGDGRRAPDKGKKKRRDERDDRGGQLEVRLRNVVGEIERFSSPSMNIGCQITEDAVRCDIKKRQYKPPRQPKSCDLAYGNAFAVGRDEPELGCVSDSALGAPTTLAYGTSTRVGSYGCNSRRDGMRCYNLRTGRGFLVSQELYEFY